ncbi:MAG: metallophosphoesterase [Armatimonadetes bacterium]|nr:metallophosphoesterase [Armatimonadota bacterium]
MRRVWAIADTHLSFARPKPMDVFGEHWRDHPARIEAACRAVIAPEDLLLMPGDLSWALRRAEAEPDLAWLAALPGIKVLAKGNHDYWWDSDRPLNSPGLHDTPFVSDDGWVGVAGTRGWYAPSGEMAAAERAQCEKIIAREIGRLERRLEAIRDCPHKFALIHYPPLEAFAPLLKAHGVGTVLYGHLHLDGGESPLPERWHGLRALCVACDRLLFRPRLVATLG